MSFCEHCQGQRYDRARILRALRQLRRDCRNARGNRQVDVALTQAINAIRDLEIPHLEYDDDIGGEIIH